MIDLAIAASVPTVVLRMKVIGRWTLWSLVAGSCLALALGCGKSEPSVVEVTGTVTHNGKAVPDLYLNFVPETGRPSWGMTDDNGHFKLNYTKEQDGAQVGTHQVWVQVRPRNPKEESNMAERIAKSPELGAILKKYGDRKTSTLRVEITSETRQIELKLD
jgi:hypothetical protein